MFTDEFEKTAVSFRLSSGSRQMMKAPVVKTAPTAKHIDTARNLMPRPGGQPKLVSTALDNKPRKVTGVNVGDLGAGGKVNQ